MSLLRNAVETAAGDDGWSALGEVGKQIANQASFDPRNYGYRKLGDLIEATQFFDFDRRGTMLMLRDKRAAKASRSERRCSPGRCRLAAPWLAPYRELGERVAAASGWCECRQALTTNAVHAGRHRRARCLGSLLRRRCRLASLRSFIAHTRSVPTRDNLHDFYNGLVWWRFAALKRRLNRLQADDIGRHGVSAKRGALRDAATLFDENAALLRAPRALTGALRSHDWQRVFIEQRALWQQSELMLFGHALLEKLVHPRKAITAHVFVWPTRRRRGRAQRAAAGVQAVPAVAGARRAGLVAGERRPSLLRRCQRVPASAGQEALDRQISLAGVVVEAEHGRVGWQARAASARSPRAWRPTTCPTSSPSSRAAPPRHLAGRFRVDLDHAVEQLDVQILRHETGPMPWIGCGDGCPPEMTGEAVARPRTPSGAAISASAPSRNR